MKKQNRIVKGVLAVQTDPIVWQSTEAMSVNALEETAKILATNLAQLRCVIALRRRKNAERPQLN